jgi:prefoldin alpha subunit
LENLENAQNAQNAQKAQELLYQLRYLKEQRDMFAGQLDLMNASLGNLINTKVTIENLKNVKDGDEILVPIGGIINIKATIKNPEKALLYVNQDVVIEKDLENSIEFIDKLIGQHNEQIKFIRAQIQNLDVNLARMSQIFQRGSSQQ